MTARGNLHGEFQSRPENYIFPEFGVFKNPKKLGLDAEFIGIPKNTGRRSDPHLPLLMDAPDATYFQVCDTSTSLLDHFSLRIPYFGCSTICKEPKETE